MIIIRNTQAGCTYHENEAVVLIKGEPTLKTMIIPGCTGIILKTNLTIVNLRTGLHYHHHHANLTKLFLFSRNALRRVFNNL